MNKAILVMDMPKSCQKCKLKSTVHGIQNVTHCCNLAEGMITLDKGFEGRLSDCPLKPMPKKRSTEYNPARNPYITEGYNACIDEILGNKTDC